MDPKLCECLYIFMILCIIYIIYNEFQGQREDMTVLSNEAVQNVSSLYNTTSFNINSANIGNFIGIICAWSGNPTNIPVGWVLCDGQGDTPDLRGRFILGAGQGAGLLFRKYKDVGGSETHTLTVAEMPAHNHDILATSGSGTSRVRRMGEARNPVPVPDISLNRGGGMPHNNMPPHYVLAYIQYIGTSAMTLS